MKISFVTQGPVRTPGGSYRVVYAYAEHLSKLGHHVRVLHPVSVPLYIKNKIHPLKRFRWLLGLLLKLISNSQPNWYRFSSEVEIKKIWRLLPKHIKASDVIIASNWPVAPIVYEVSSICGIPMLQFVHHYEVFSGYFPKDVHRALALPVIKIAVSKWTYEVLEKVGVSRLVYIPNGVDQKIFRVFVPPENRSPSICFMYVPKGIKGPEIGVEVLRQVKKVMPSLKVILFGPLKEGPKLPFDYEYFGRVSDEELVKNVYNKSSIFLSTSFVEGFALPVAEAMACGCAVVTTDSGGVRELAVHEKTAIVTPVGDVKALTKGVLKLLNDRSLCIRLAYMGRSHVKNYDWEKSAKKLESLIENILSLSDKKNLGE